MGVAPTGSIFMFGGTTAPGGTVLCDGSALSRTAFSNLFSIISTIYGAGDGTSTFNVPNFVARMPLGPSGTHAIGTRGGTEVETLSTAQMPSHTHPGVNHQHPFTGVDHLHYMDHTHPIPAGQFSHAHTIPSALANVTVNSPGGSPLSMCQHVLADSTAAATLPAGGTTNASTAYTSAADRSLASTTAGADRDLTTGATGGGGSHNNLPPFQVVQFIIKT
jgi:microcystin-dependent protein